MSQLSAPNLNLLSRKRVKFDKQYRLAATVKFWSGVVLVVYVGLLVAVVAVAQIFHWKQVEVEKALTSAKLTLASQVVLINQYQSVQSRSKIIKKVLGERREVIDLWQNIRSILPEGTEMQNFSIKQNVLNIGFSATHVVKANQIVDMIKNQLGSLGIEKTEFSVSRADDASYSIVGQMTLANKQTGEDK